MREVLYYYKGEVCDGKRTPSSQVEETSAIVDFIENHIERGKRDV